MTDEREEELNRLRRAIKREKTYDLGGARENRSRRAVKKMQGGDRLNTQLVWSNAENPMSEHGLRNRSQRMRSTERYIIPGSYQTEPAVPGRSMFHPLGGRGKLKNINDPSIWGKLKGEPWGREKYRVKEKKAHAKEMQEVRDLIKGLQKDQAKRQERRLIRDAPGG